MYCCPLLSADANLHSQSRHIAIGIHEAVEFVHPVEVVRVPHCTKPCVSTVTGQLCSIRDLDIHNPWRIVEPLCCLAHEVVNLLHIAGRRDVGVEALQSVTRHYNSHGHRKLRHHDRESEYVMIFLHLRREALKCSSVHVYRQIVRL